MGYDFKLFLSTTLLCVVSAKISSHFYISHPDGVWFQVIFIYHILMGYDFKSFLHRDGVWCQVIPTSWWGLSSSDCYIRWKRWQRGPERRCSAILNPLCSRNVSEKPFVQHQSAARNPCLFFHIFFLLFFSSFSVFIINYYLIFVIKSHYYQLAVYPWFFWNFYQTVAGMALIFAMRCTCCIAETMPSWKHIYLKTYGIRLALSCSFFCLNFFIRFNLLKLPSHGTIAACLALRSSRLTMEVRLNGKGGGEAVRKQDKCEWKAKGRERGGEEG